MPPPFARFLAAVLAVPAATWVRRQERRGLLSGVPLTGPERADAAALGVRDPDRVRVVRVAWMPMPNGLGLRRLAGWAGVLVPEAAGLCLGHVVFVRAPFWENRRDLVAHELVHVVQYERLGGARAFLQRYFEECLTVGYAVAPMEREARERSAGLR